MYEEMTGIEVEKLLAKWYYVLVPLWPKSDERGRHYNTV